MNPAGQSLPGKIAFDDQWLTLTWPDGVEGRFPALWLRDNVPDARRGESGQRLFDAIELPPAPAIAGAVLEDETALSIRFAPDGAEARFSCDWLRRHRPGAGPEDRPATWDASLQGRLHSDRYERIASEPAALAGWLKAVRDQGVALLNEVPCEPGMVCKVAELFGYVRETNYGRLFDVISEPDPENLANSDRALGLHCDNPYREPVPGLQLLHCLEAGVAGGETLLADGFHAAQRLRAERPDLFDLLARTPVAFRYVAEGVDLRARRPLIQLDAEGRIAGVCYNNRSLQPFDLPAEALPAFYEAYRAFGSLLHDPAGIVSFRLASGDLFIVDNRRVLHGRGGFSGGRRRLQGCYADKDGLESRLRVLEANP